jgi:hypothetical protein
MSKAGAIDEDKRAGELEELALACHDINGSLAAIVTCLEYLAGRTSGEMLEAVEDAFSAARRIEGIAAQLRLRCSHVPPRAA